MSKALKCDRCGKFFEPYMFKQGYEKSTNYIRLETKNANIYVNDDRIVDAVYDLCEDCNSELEQFLNKYKKYK